RRSKSRKAQGRWYPRPSGELVSVCPVCYRENEPVADRCPSCSAPRIRAVPAAPPEEAASPRPRTAHPTAGPRSILKGAAGAEIVQTGQAGELEGVVGRTSAKATFVPVEQIQDINQLKRDYERLRVGHECSSCGGLERDLNELLARILEIALDLIPCDNGVIL